MLVFRRIGRDALRSLGVRPGKIEVPAALREALERSFSMRKKSQSNAAYIPIAETNAAFIPIAQTTKIIVVARLAYVSVYDVASYPVVLLSSEKSDRQFVVDTAYMY
jgi:hypothetical protein